MRRILCAIALLTLSVGCESAQGTAVLGEFYRTGAATAPNLSTNERNLYGLMGNMLLRSAQYQR
jgi:hypothetical protein